jgi:hypothetical protein
MRMDAKFAQKQPWISIWRRSTHLLVTNLVDERGVSQFLQLRDLQRHSSGNNANISSLISSGSYNPVGPEYSLFHLCHLPPSTKLLFSAKLWWL